jgi:molybdopterin/thiamine biosynthesis adenylyltransferase
VNSRRAFFRHLASAAAQAGAAAREAADPEARPMTPEEREAAAPPVPLSDGELERYGRQLALPEWGLAQQGALRDAHVLVIGAGALGSPVAMYLAGAGVGRLGILDDDAVELSNLHRQFLHGTPDVGAPKAESAATTLRLLNPEIVIEPYRVRFGRENAAALLESQDLVVDCSDAYATRYAVNAACCESRVPLVEAGVTGFSGLVMAIRPGESPCYRCAFPTAPSGGPSCTEAGVLGAAAGVVGSLQALKALRLLARLDDDLLDGFLQVDLLAQAFVRVAVTRRPDCPDCSSLSRPSRNVPPEIGDR